ncbi:head-tail connector protein [Sphingomonas sp. BK069]|uniref:head-tail connector protein n=1 Tax=Sphingomonas sp. BK069 TaxID=2586979 RepID=UPI00161A6E5A|nr:head-tail connector protein [Sphingomonas sp. BK069]MBB3347323.1 putative phiE125 gp8 family phage protein [Sphingomonas sp. BK069]
MRVVVITPPEPVVSLKEAKDHLRVRHSAEDALITGMVAAATQLLDGPGGDFGRALGVQTLEARFGVSAFGSSLRLPYPPLIEILSISYLDRSDQTVTADLVDFIVDGAELAPAGSTFAWEGGSLRSDAVRIRYRAGYPDNTSGAEPVSTLPAAVRAAILLMVGDLYRNRDTVTPVQAISIPMSTTVDRLLEPLRVYAR